MKIEKYVNEVLDKGIGVIRDIQRKNPINKYYQKTHDYIKKMVDKYIDK